jgi:hypothetical protein
MFSGIVVASVGLLASGNDESGFFTSFAIGGGICAIAGIPITISGSSRKRRVM